MAQFAVYRNQDPATRQRVPLLLDVQHDLLGEFASRVVVPLYPVADVERHVVGTLTPVFEIEGRGYVVVTQEIAGIPRSTLGGAVIDLSSRRDDIVAALSLLIAGI